MTLRLSDAIRLGAMLHPQCFEVMYTLDDHFEITATCAVGAAIQAGYTFAYLLGGQRMACPACGHYDEPIVGIIQHLNDAHRWTRERIAAWVATLEPLTPATPVRDTHAPSETPYHAGLAQDRAPGITAETMADPVSSGGRAGKGCSPGSPSPAASPQRMAV